jgi:tetratricopeptide (TPR) repeat protein
MTNSMNKEQIMKQGFIFYNDPATSDQAAEYFEKAIALDPQYVDGYFWLAYCLWEYSCDWDKAEKIAREGLKMDPSRADLHLILAWIIERLRGYTPEYEKQLRRAIFLEPTWLTPRCCLIEYLLSKNEFNEAKEQLKEAINQIQDIVVSQDRIKWKYESFITGRISEFWKKYLLDENEQELATAQPSLTREYLCS